MPDESRVKPWYSARCRETIEDVANALDCEKIAAAMKAVGWKWGHAEEAHFPDAAEVRASALHLLESAMQTKKGWVVESGGFTASFAKGHPSIEFTLASASCDCHDAEYDREEPTCG